ncbi:hypothetical protein ACCP99_15330 [Xanthomonas sp. NCPPB 3443]|uniref:hypothetical protein n=1 Tax=Xanthomonas sp. NCPPB 3443 TaxID=3243407 RepID=UPI003555C161
MGDLLRPSNPFPKRSSRWPWRCARPWRRTRSCAPIQQNQAQILAEIQQQATHPRSALLACLALEGMKLLESLDYVQWPSSQRQQLLQDIGALIDTPPR